MNLYQFQLYVSAIYCSSPFYFFICYLRCMLIQLFQTLQTTSKRLAEKKIAKFEKNIARRGSPVTSWKKKLTAENIGLAFFACVVIGSCMFIQSIYFCPCYLQNILIYQLKHRGKYRQKYACVSNYEFKKNYYEDVTNKFLLSKIHQTISYSDCGGLVGNRNRDINLESDKELGVQSNEATVQKVLKLID